MKLCDGCDESIGDNCCMGCARWFCDKCISNQSLGVCKACHVDDEEEET